MIRKERLEDFHQIDELITAAFKEDKHSDGTEQLLVKRLRNSDAYRNDLALLYQVQDKILGYILLSEIMVKDHSLSHLGLSLAPDAVLPSHQNLGIGSALIEKAHEVASRLGYTFVVLIGHENYYPRFGYQLAENFDLNFPFDAPSKNCLVKELSENALSKISGLIHYPQEFYG